MSKIQTIIPADFQNKYQIAQEANGFEVYIDGFSSRTLVATLPTEELANDLIKLLQNLYNHISDSVVGDWSVVDIHTVATQAEIDLTQSEANEIFEKLKSDFDASVGISWGTLEDAVSDYAQNRSKTTER